MDGGRQRRETIDHRLASESWSIFLSWSGFACLILCGCHQLSNPPRLTRSIERLTGDAIPVAEAESLLELRDGKESLLPKWKLNKDESYRWNTDGLSAVLDSEEATSVLNAVLTSKSIEHRTIAAIGRQRLGISAANLLHKGIESNRVSPATRCAALETFLASLDKTRRGNELAKLRKEWLPRENGTAPVPEELQIELLTILGSTKDVGAIDLKNWLRSRSNRVRQVALITAENKDAVLDTDLLDMLERESHPKVKVETIHFLGKHAHDSMLGQRQIEAALTDTRYEMRKAAAEALSQLANEPARRLLRTRLAEGGIGRVEKSLLITAVAAAGDAATAFQYANDSNARIREGVAKSLRYDRDRSTTAVEIAERYLSDSSTAVTLALVRSLEQWPLEDAGPFLFSMMRMDRRATIRKEAAKQIAARLAKRDEKLSHLESNFGRLQSIWETEYGTLEQNWQRLHTQSRRLETLSYHTTKLSKAVDDLLSDDAWVRREAARAIAQEAAVVEMPASLRQRLVNRLERETDPQIWMLSLQSFARQRSNEGTLAAYLAIQHASRKVRLAGLDYLDRFRSPDHAAVVLTLWNDREPEVVVRALQLYSACDGSHDDRLIRLKDSRNSQVSLAAAIALCRIDDPRGPPTVSLLSKHHSPATRKLAVEGMGRLADVRFVPDVIQAMSDTNSSIRDAAFAAIEPLVADQATILQARSMEGRNRAAFWRRWHSDRIRKRR